MMEMLRQHVQRPVVVLDPSRSVLAEAGVRRSDRIALRRIQGALRDTRHGVVTRGSGCLGRRDRPRRPSSRMALHPRQTVGDIDGRTCTALEQAISIVTFELMRIERSLEAEASSLRELADQLIGDPTSDRVPSLAKALGYDLSRPHRVLAVSGGEESDDQVALTENTLRSLNLGPPLVATNRDRLFVALPDEDQPSLEVELLLSDVAQALEKALGATSVSASGRRTIRGSCEHPWMKQSSLSISPCRWGARTGLHASISWAFGSSSSTRVRPSSFVDWLSNGSERSSVTTRCNEATWSTRSASTSPSHVPRNPPPPTCSFTGTRSGTALRRSLRSRDATSAIPTSGSTSSWLAGRGRCSQCSTGSMPPSLFLPPDDCRK